MLPYYFLFGIPILYAIINELIYEKNERIEEKKNYTITIFFFIYAILLSFRSDNVGVDTARYLEIYETVGNLSWGELRETFENSEIGYFFFSKIVGSIFGNEQVIIIVTALMSVLPIAYLYYRETKNCLVSMSLFLTMPIFQMAFSGIRQAVAMAFVVPALYYIKERKLLKFILVVFFATLFHRSAFIILLMYPLYFMNIKLKNAALLIPIGLVILRFNTQIYLWMAVAMGDRFEERYAYTTETGAYTMLIVYVIFTLYAFVVMDESRMDESAKGFRNYLVIATFLQMFTPVNPIAMRLNYYFILFIPIVITQINYYSKIRDKRVRFLIDVAVFFTFMLYYIDKAHSMDILGIYPYEFFFQ